MTIIAQKNVAEIKSEINALNTDIRCLINEFNFNKKIGREKNGLYAKKNYLKLLRKELLEKEQSAVNAKLS